MRPTCQLHETLPFQNARTKLAVLEYPEHCSDDGECRLRVSFRPRIQASALLAALRGRFCVFHCRVPAKKIKGIGNRLLINTFKNPYHN